MHDFGIYASIFLTILFTCTGIRITRAATWTFVTLTDKEKMDIVHHHNDLRRLSGSSNMRFMSWDSELEWVAQEYSKQCRFEHNDQRKHTRGWSVGENLYATTSTNVNIQDALRAIQLWYDEHRDFNYDTRSCAPNRVCGHYTQIVWAQTFKVGCALTKCHFLTKFRQNSNPSGSIFVCNYAMSGNVVGQDGHFLSVFEKGSSCSKCGENDYCRNHLCANSERDFIFEDEKRNIYESQIDGNGKIAAIIVLSIIAFFLILFIIYRERARISVKLGLWKQSNVKSTRFSNQNTPAGSKINTPRHSISGLHGVQRITAADIGSPLERLKALEKGQCFSTQNTPRRTPYSNGTSTPPRMPPPFPPPSLPK